MFVSRGRFEIVLTETLSDRVDEVNGNRGDVKWIT